MYHENVAHNGQLFISICRRVEIRIILIVRGKKLTPNSYTEPGYFSGENTKIVPD